METNVFFCRVVTEKIVEACEVEKSSCEAWERRGCLNAKTAQEVAEFEDHWNKKEKSYACF